MSIMASNNVNLFGYHKFFLKLKNLHDSSLLPNKIIFEGNNGIGKSTFVYHFINYIFSKNEDYKYNFKDNKISEKNISYNLLIKNSHPNLFIISNDDEKNISQINKVREMINFTNKSSFNNNYKIVLIDNIELLSINSINALLKVIEEPNSNLYFFLIHNSNVKILNTLNSRCIKFRMFLSSSEKFKVIENLINNDFYSNLNIDFKSSYDTPGQILNLQTFFKEENINENISIEEFLNLIIKKSLYKKNSFVKKNLPNFIELYFKKKINFLKSKDKIYYYYKYFLLKLNESNKYNLDIDSILIEFKTKFING